jgi:hypothetical protein
MLPVMAPLPPDEAEAEHPVRVSADAATSPAATAAFAVRVLRFTSPPRLESNIDYR